MLTRCRFVLFAAAAMFHAFDAAALFLSARCFRVMII